MDCSMPGFLVHHQLLTLLKLVSIKLQWHPTIHPLSHLQSFPVSGSFQMSQGFTAGGPSIGVSVSASVLPMNIQDWFPLGWTGWISLQSKGLSTVFSNTTVSIVSPSICHEVMGLDTMIFVFMNVEFKANFFTLLFHFHQEALYSLSVIRVVSSAYLRLSIFLPAILIPVCASSSPAFLMTYSAYKLNKHGDNIQHWCILFLIWNQSVVPCTVLTVASWPAYRFLRRQVRWSSIPISWRIFHSLLWSTQSKALA